MDKLIILFRVRVNTYYNYCKSVFSIYVVCNTAFTSAIQANDLRPSSFMLWHGFLQCMSSICMMRIINALYTVNMQYKYAVRYILFTYIYSNECLLKLIYVPYEFMYHICYHTCVMLHTLPTCVLSYQLMYRTNLRTVPTLLSIKLSIQWLQSSSM